MLLPAEMGGTLHARAGARQPVLLLAGERDAGLPVHFAGHFSAEQAFRLQPQLNLPDVFLAFRELMRIRMPLLLVGVC